MSDIIDWHVLSVAMYAAMNAWLHGGKVSDWNG